MKRDIKYIIKRILIGTGIALLLGFLKGGLILDTYAATTSYTLYSSDYSTLWSNTVTTNQNINVQNVSRVRINFNNAIESGSTYQLQLNLDLTATDYVPYFSVSAICVGGTCQDSEISVVSSTITPSGSSSFLREAVITYTFTSDTTSTSNFFEGQLNHVSRITYLNASITLTKVSDNTAGQIINSTNDIINNNNNNTQQIIDNQNQNTSDMIDSQKVCSSRIIDYNSVIETNKYLTSSGTVASAANYGISDFYELDVSSDSIEVTKTASQNICFYDENKTFISCHLSNSLGFVTIPNNSTYFRASFYINGKSPIYNWKYCKNGNQALNDSINETNNTLNDDNVDESSNKAQEFFNDFDSGDTGNLTDIISLPLDFLDRLNDTCSPIVLPIPYFGNLTLPCIQTYLAGFLPENLLTLVRLVVNGFLMYKIIASLVDFINSLKDPNNDDLEVMDL